MFIHETMIWWATYKDWKMKKLLISKWGLCIYVIDYNEYINEHKEHESVGFNTGFSIEKLSQIRITYGAKETELFSKKFLLK